MERTAFLQKAYTCFRHTAVAVILVHRELSLLIVLSFKEIIEKKNG